MGDLWDAIVVGLGPAGASAAALMAKSGLRVLALERAPKRRKACGGLITGKFNEHFPPNWQSIVETPVHRVELAAGDIRVDSLCKSPLGFLVDRARFDGFLRRRAEEEGVEALTESVASVYEEGGVVKVRTLRKVHTARYVVGAGGANCPCARFVAGSRLGVKAVGLAGETDLPEGFRAGSIRLVMGLTSYGYGWFFPREGTLNLGLTERSEFARRLNPAFQRLMGSEVFPSSLRWLRARAIPCYDGRRRLFGQRVALAGDAAGLVDPLSGEGISYAVASGAMAGATVLKALEEHGGSLLAYGSWVKERLSPELRAAGLLARVIFRVPRRFTALVRASPELMQYYMDVLGGRRKYQGFTAQILKAIGAVFRERLCRMVA